MDGLSLGIGFSYMPNSLRFCGPEQAHADFLRYLKSRDNAPDVENDLKRFEGLYAYLSAIASRSGKHFTDYEVVEAYWIGNALLDGFGREDVAAILAALVKRGLPASVAENRVKNLPRAPFPHHNFNVCYVGVGQITGAVPTTIRNMNDCMTIAAEVVDVRDCRLVARRKFLEMSESGLQLGREREIEVAYLPQLTPDVAIGDVVAVHWGFAPVILAQRQQRNLERYTKKVLASVNAQPLATASL